MFTAMPNRYTSKYSTSSNELSKKVLGVPIEETIPKENIEPNDILLKYTQPT